MSDRILDAWLEQDAMRDDDGDGVSTESQRRGASQGSATAAGLAMLARCDAAVSLAPKLAASPDLAFAFDEARMLARTLPDRRSGTRAPRWSERPRLAWGVAVAASAVAVFVTVANLTPTPDREPVALAPLEPTATRAAPRVFPANIDDRLAKVDPVVLIADGVPVDGRSLAVLPFVVTNEKDRAAGTGAAADALYARLIDALETVPGLVVIDPGVASGYANSELTPEQIALYLGVRAVVEGQVAAAGDTLSIGLRFTDAAADSAAVTRSFAGPADAAGAFERDIATSVLEAMSGGASTEFNQTL